VGSYDIYTSDVAFKNAIQMVYTPSGTGDYGLKQMVAAYTSAQVLVNNGVAMGDAEIAKEEARIDRETMDPPSD
jgi:hypothetical protein